MAQVYLSIGSNINRAYNIRSAIKRLHDDFGGLHISTIYETPAVGFKGDAFYNLAAHLQTELSYDQALAHFKQIELDHARSKNSQKFSARTLDIDILLYDDLVLQPNHDLPRKEITKYHFVLFPLAEIAPDVIHPELNLSIAELAQQSTLDKTALNKVSLMHNNYPSSACRPFKGVLPSIDSSAYIDPQSVIIGDVHIGEDSSVWPMTVIRGDVNHIRIGKRSNVQDGSVLHVAHDSKDYTREGGYPLLVGDDVTVGHKAVLHACTIGNRCLIGMGAVLLDGCVLEDDTMIAAGSVVPPRKVLESGYLWVGSPVKRLRELTDKEKDFLRYSAKNYVSLAKEYQA